MSHSAIVVAFKANRFSSKSITLDIRVRVFCTDLRGSASAPSLGLDLGLLALGQPERERCEE